ncbi:hypothetical protein DYB31_012084 [Aphanomyces astaci]|uniref:Uncharacterized protein n=1 Tax=Aphanomyces astaci TaxID=112090 RepID=A0A397FU25_APHAT|nr:hypothetical protein DYB31_012084 [Aphanomyces astaci]
MTVKKRNLTNSEREAILREVLLHSNGNYLVRLPNGLSQTLAAKYNCHPATVRRVLALAKGQGVANGNMKVSVASKKKGRVGRKKAYTAEKYPYVRLDRTFMTLQACLVETIRLMGDNTYKVPHMSKEKKKRNGLLPKNVMCPRDVYAAAKNQLLAVDGAELD